MKQVAWAIVGKDRKITPSVKSEVFMPLFWKKCVAEEYIEFGDIVERVHILCRDSVNYRFKKHYDKRRKAGRCIRCNEKTKENPWRKEPYRYCETHRKDENDKKQLKRDKS